MKKIFKLIIITILTSFLLLPFNIKALTSQEISAMDYLEHFELLVKNIDETHEYYYQTKNLNSAQKALYRSIVDFFSSEFDNFNKTINIVPEKALTGAELETALKAFLADYKVFFWLKGDVYYTNSKTNIKLDFVVIDIYDSNYNNEINYLEAFKMDLKEIVTNREKIKHLVDAAANTYQKIKAIHDWLGNNNEYNKVGEVSHAPPGALVARHSPVCEAYSEAFQMIANYVGIKSIYATGDATQGNPPETVGHAWNYVYIVKTWYFLDVTWAKPSGSQILNYNYFLRDVPTSHQQDIDELKPSPFTTTQYSSTNLATFEVVSSFDYEKTGEAIAGFESIQVKGGVFGLSYSLKYYDKNDVLLTGAPIDIGKYYVVVEVINSIFYHGDYVIHFQIHPKMYQVQFFDYDDNIIKDYKVVEGEAATAPDYYRDGYKLIGWDQSFQVVNSNLEIRPIHEPITIIFKDLKGNVLEIELDENRAVNITNVDFETDDDNFFVGWQANDQVILPTDILTKDLILTPLIEKIEIKVSNATLKNDGIYYLNQRYYKKENITLNSVNQKIISSKMIEEPDEEELYKIKLVIKATGSNNTKEVIITLKRTNDVLFGLTTRQILIVVGIGVGSLFIISRMTKAIKRRRDY